MRMILAATALLAVAPDAAAQTGSAPQAQADGDRDAQCFVLAAVGSQQLMTNPNVTPEARQAEPRLRATATYFAGRLSTRLTGEPLRRALADAADVVQRVNRGPLIEGCMGEFQAFMRSLGTPAPAATPRRP